MISHRNDHLRYAPTRGLRAPGIAVLLLLASFPAGAVAQRAIQIPGRFSQTVSPSDLLPQNTKLARQLDLAQQEISEGNYRVALRRLGFIVGAEQIAARPGDNTVSEDFFYSTTPEDPESFHGLKAAALDMLGALPAEGRKAYEGLYGQLAQLKLTQALETDDTQLLAETARRFLHTAAGDEAAYRLASLHMDHGRPLAAVRIYERLLASPTAAQKWQPIISLKAAVCWARVGNLDKAVEQWVAVRQNYADAVIRLAGARIEIPLNQDDALNHLDQLFRPAKSVTAARLEYQYPGGNPSRNQIQPPIFPFLNPVWSAATTGNNGVREILTTWQAALADAEDLSIPAGEPIIVDDLLIAPILGTPDSATAAAIRAYDLKSGATRWQTAADVTFDPLPPSPHYNGAPPEDLEDLRRDVVAKERAWKNRTFASLSSDGAAVFAVEELQAISTNRNVVTASNSSTNVLRAYSVTTGSLLWEIGGEKDDIAPLPVSDTFFLGAPLPLAGRLYCLAERDRHIQLFVLNPETGELLWAQSLYATNLGRQAFHAEAPRRMAGLSPAYSHGLMICPTGMGGVVAVDIEQRALQWQFRFPNNLSGSSRLPQYEPAVSSIDLMPGQEGPCWLNSTPLIAGNKVLIAAHEAHQLFCLDSASGEQLWNKPQLDRKQVVGALGDRVAVLGRNKLELFHLDTGKPALEHATEIPRPSGMAAISGRHVLVPLSTAEVIAIDMSSGRIASRAATADGSVLGNLICLPHAVIAQGLTSVVRFQDLSEIKERLQARLQEHPDDISAQLTRAEVARQEGDLDQAVALLRSASQATEDISVKTKLLDLLLLGLKRDFTKFAAAHDEIEALLDQVEIAEKAQPQSLFSELPLSSHSIVHDWDELDRVDRRGLALRLFARGWLETGDYARGFEAGRKYAALDQGERFDRVGERWGLRRDQWFSAYVARLLREAPDEVKAAVDEMAAEEFAAAIDPKHPAMLRRFVMRFRSHPRMAPALQAMVGATAEGFSPLEAEFALFQLRRQTNDATAAEATASLAGLLIEFNRVEEAIPYLKELQNDWGEKPVLQSKTGRELVEAWTKESPVVEKWQGPSAWPMGRINVNHINKPRQQQMMTPEVQMLEVRERRGTPLTLRWSAINQNENILLTAYNGQQQPVWNVEIATDHPAGQINYSTEARGCGDLVVVRTGNELLAIDSLGWLSATESDETRVRTGQLLWRKTLEGPYPPSSRISMALEARGVDERGRPLGALGPVTPSAVYYQMGRSLFAADPFTGATLWQRGGIEHRSRLFADDDRLMVVSPDSKTATFFSATDGTELGSRPNVTGNTLIAAVDGHVLNYEYLDEKIHFRFRHLWSTDQLWERQFPQQSLFTRVGHDELAVLSPDGQLTVLAINTGASQFECKLDPPDETRSLTVLPAADIYTVVLNHPIPGHHSRITIPRYGRFQPVNGTAFGIERSTGKELWSKQVLQMTLDLNQPRETPLLVFVGTQPNRVPNRRSAFTVHGWDKRTGKKLINPNLVSHQILRYDVDPQAHVIKLDLGYTATEVTFTDEPVTTSEEAEADGEPDED